MKSLLISVLLCIPSLALAEDAVIRVVEHGTETTLTDGKAVSSLVALVESASHDSTEYANPAKRWDTDLRTPAHLHAHFQPKRQIQVRGADQRATDSVSVSDVLIVFAEKQWVDHILLKTENGYLSVTTYEPCALTRLVFALPLKEVPERFSHLRDVYCAQFSPI